MYNRTEENQKTYLIIINCQTGAIIVFYDYNQIMMKNMDGSNAFEKYFIISYSWISYFTVISEIFINPDIFLSAKTKAIKSLTLDFNQNRSDCELWDVLDVELYL